MVTVSPVAQPQRRIPFDLRHKVESEIRKLEREDIIEKISEDTPTDWVSHVVIVPKQDNNIWLCVDFSQTYHQLELSPTSRHITTFCAHVGLYGCKRLNYGTNAAAELFQHSLQETLYRG